MIDGWIKLYRQSLDHWTYKEKPFDRFHAWVDLMLSANHEDNKMLFDGELITVKRGQLVTSMRKLGERWGWDRRTVRNFLDVLEKDGMLSIECTTRCTTLTIVNYGKFQDGSTTECTTDAPLNVQVLHHSMYTNKNDKNDKKGKNNNICEIPLADCTEIILKDGTMWRPSQRDFDMWVQTFPRLDVKQEFLKMAAWSDANREKRKTAAGVKRFVVSWLNRAQEDGSKANDDTDRAEYDDPYQRYRIITGSAGNS